MKLYLFLNKFFLISIAISVFSILFIEKASANNDEEVKKITSKLRCMTCQNQTIYESSSDFSLYIKKLVEEKTQNKQSEKEIINFLVKRYGQYIVFEPQMNKQNIFLWFFPFVIMALSLVFLIIRIKKN